MPKKNTNKKILLFSFERSGSTTLLHLLNNILEMELFHEPFNKYESRYFKQKNSHGLQTSLAAIKEKYPGFKHVQGHLSFEENQELLHDSDFHIIFLYRKNPYARSMSIFLSNQTKIWHKDQQKRLAHKKSAIEIDHVQKEIDSYETRIGIYKKFLQDSKIPHTELTYESLFGEEVSPESKVEILKEAFQSERSLPSDDDLLEKVKDFLSPKKKYNTQQIYRQIPNMEEIDAMFGPQYGYILKEEEDFWSLLKARFGLGKKK